MPLPRVNRVSHICNVSAVYLSHYFSVPNIYFIFFYEQIFKMIYEHITKEMKIKPVFP